MPSGILQPPYRSFTEPNIKCYTFVVPYLKDQIVDKYSIYLNKTFLPYLLPADQGGIALSYKNQINQRNLQIKMIGNYLNIDEKNLHDGIEIQITKISRINLRNKPNSPCDEDWEKQDLKMMEITAEKMGCRHPHLNIKPDLPLCTKLEEIQNFTWSMFKGYSRPCISILDSIFELIWDPDRYYDQNLFRIRVTFLATQVQETLQVS